MIFKQIYFTHKLNKLLATLVAGDPKASFSSSAFPYIEV